MKKLAIKLHKALLMFLIEKDMYKLSICLATIRKKSVTELIKKEKIDAVRLNYKLATNRRNRVFK